LRVMMRYRMLLLSCWNKCLTAIQSDSVYVPCLQVCDLGIKLVWIFWEFVLFDSIILPNIVIPSFWNTVMRLCFINLLSNASSGLESVGVLYCSPEDQNMNLHFSENLNLFTLLLERSTERHWK
jgi:hypothetical protein